jgi:hypothetical protein
MRADGFHLGFKRIGYVHDEARFEFVPLNEFKIMMRAVPLLFRAAESGF